jgi:Uma2 family endonuclease
LLDAPSAGCYDSDMVTTSPITTAQQLLEAAIPQPCELVRGELVTMSPAGFDHGWIAYNVATALGDHVTQRRLGRVVAAETGFWIEEDPDTVLAPDVAFVRAERIPPGGQRGFFRGPPDLAVEVLSPSDRASEVNEKVQQWLAAGTVVVWVVDPPARSVTVYRSRREAVILGMGDVLTCEDLLPGFQTPVADLFAG